jgi:hypothetical protein
VLAEARFGVYDVDTLYGYFPAKSPIAPASANRIAPIELKRTPI